MAEVLLLPVGKSVKPRQKYNGNDAFSILGISLQSSQREIKRAYLELAGQYHPDKNSSPEAMKEFVRINKAYEFIIKGGDIARYLVLCNIAQSKQKLVEALTMIKRTKLLTGVDLATPRPNLNNDRGFMSDEEWNQQQKLFFGLQMKCPSCKWKEGCNIATGFNEVEDVWQQIIEKATQQAFGSIIEKITPKSILKRVVGKKKYGYQNKRK